MSCPSIVTPAVFLATPLTQCSVRDSDRNRLSPMLLPWIIRASPHAHTAHHQGEFSARLDFLEVSQHLRNCTAQDLFMNFG